MINKPSVREPISIDALKAGDRAAFAQMVNEFSDPIYRLGLKMTGNSADAEDVLQETFLKAICSISSFEARSSLSTWLYRIALNEALMLLRKRKPELQLAEEHADEEEDEQSSAFEIVDWCCIPENELLSGEARQFIQKAIDALPERLKVVFLLRDMEGLSIRETADALGLTETAVKTRLLRARFRLRQELSTYYGEKMLESEDE